MSRLGGLRFAGLCVMSGSCLKLAPTLALCGATMGAETGAQPRPHVRARLERVNVRQRAQQGFLAQVVGTIHVPAQGNRECAETWHRTEHGFADRFVHGHQWSSFFFSLPFRRLMSSLNRSGTP